jgi:hypothetical protein
MEDLKNHVRNYRDVDDQLIALNRQVYEKRLERKDLEDKMAKLLSGPQYSTVDKLKLDDNSHILIKHPATYSKTWSISKRDLKDLLDDLFNRSEGYLTADEIYKHLVTEQSKKLVATEFNFNRVVKE